MHFELPAPSMTFDVVLNDGAKIRMRRHGNPDGVRLLLTHGNGFAADAYYPYWQHLLQKFDLLVFDFRNHGRSTENTTIVNHGVRWRGCRREKIDGSCRCSASDHDSREIPISPALVAMNRIVAASTPT